MIFGTKFTSEDEVEEWFEQEKQKLEDELYKQVHKHKDDNEKYKAEYTKKLNNLMEAYEEEHKKLLAKKDYKEEE